MSAHRRRNVALAALAAVAAGTRACDAETEQVDFKEELGTRGRGGAHQSIPPTHEPAAQALAEEVGCLANSLLGGVLIIGVDDRIGGSDALVGAQSDAAWLKARVHALTSPHYTVDIEELITDGTRLLLIDVPPALEEIRAGGKLRARVGSSCEELSGDRAREFLERRRGYDWSAEPSGSRLSHATSAALASARVKYQSAKGVAPASDLELVRRLGVLIGDGSETDPELTQAGALLLTPLDPGLEQLVVLDVLSEGRPSRHSVRGPAPLLEIFDEAWAQLTGSSFPETVTVIGAGRRLMRAIPDYALREAIVNAIMHRDYRLARSSITVHAINGMHLKVRSPGGFVSGLRADRLITAPSTPRNPALASAMRVLGLAEREGVGIDIMYEQMLRAGHPAPSITESGGEVVVTLLGGRPDVELLAYFDELAARDQSLDGVRTAMAITELFSATPLRSERLASIAQCTRVEAEQTLIALEAAGELRRLVRSGRAYTLADPPRERFHSRLRYTPRRALDQHSDLVRAFLDSHPQIGREDAASLLGVVENSASRILAELTRQGVIEPVSNARGPRVRYRLVAPSTSTHAPNGVD